MVGSRLLPLGAAILVVALTGAGPAQAYFDGPWCAVFTTGSSSVSERCDMPNFEACRQEAQFFGPTAFCRQNSRYAPYWGVGGESPRRRATNRKHRHRHAR